MHKVLINNESIAFEDHGSGIPLLLVHPPGMGRKVFYEQSPLANHFRVIIPDLVGQGDSSYNGKSEISIARFSSDLIALLDHLNIKSAIIFGYSSGGTIAQYLAIHFKHRVQALILSGGYPIVDNFIFKNQHRLGIMAVERNKHFLARVLAYSHTRDKNFRKILEEHMIKSNTSVWSKYYLDSLLFNCKKEIQGLSIPTLLMYGSKSDHINTYLKFYKTNLPNTDIYVVQGESHQLPTKQPSYINQMISGFILNQT